LLHGDAKAVDEKACYLTRLGHDEPTINDPNLFAAKPRDGTRPVLAAADRSTRQDESLP
jgi:hypothetical protein